MYAQALTNDQLFRVAPSIFAEEAHHSTSDRYQFLPTIDVVEALRAEGFAPVKAMQSRSRIEDRRGFTKHMIRFAPMGDNMGFKGVNDEQFQLVLTNSHVGSSAFNLSAGVYRLVCSNGMVVATGQPADVHRVRHSGRQATMDNVIEGVYRIVDTAQTVQEQMEIWKGTNLLPEVQSIFARSALALRYGEEEAPIEANQLLRTRRWADNKDDQWTVFNRIQENMIKGGLHGVGSTGRNMTTREVKSVDGDTKLNRALWMLSTEMNNLLNRG